MSFIGYFWLLGLVLVCPAAMAAPDDEVGLRISYDVGGAPVTFLRDGAGVVQVDGLDVPGLVLYRPRSKTVYYQNPAWPRWVMVSPEAFEGMADEAKGVAGAAWTPFLDKPVRRWDIDVRQDTDEGGCGTWFGSPGVGAMVGMQADDFLRILSVVNWLNGGRQVHCHVVMPARGEGSQWGWPVRWQTDHDVAWQLREVVRVGLSDFVLPADVVPVTDEARLAMMVAQLTAEERKAFVTEAGRMPIVQQVQLLEQLLAEGGE